MAQRRQGTAEIGIPAKVAASLGEESALMWPSRTHPELEVMRRMSGQVKQAPERQQ